MPGPHILQVFEWYREGVCGGGHYKYDATLMDSNGKVTKLMHMLNA